MGSGLEEKRGAGLMKWFASISPVKVLLRIQNREANHDPYKNTRN
jgi:hypothetical protein